VFFLFWVFSVREISVIPRLRGQHVAVALLLAICLPPLGVRAADNEAVGIGEPAPALEIEHWFSRGSAVDGKRVEFGAGHVYVVEFWATWCQPCIASMPHLAELQRKYADAEVRIISVSNQNRETVQAFLRRALPEGSAAAAADGRPATYAELTAAYLLATDPDGSVFADYLGARAEQGIPYAYIVDREGLIAWGGRPIDLDEPLGQIVSGDWDRQAFARGQRREREFATMLSDARRAIVGPQRQQALEDIATVLEETKDASKVLMAGSLLVMLPPADARRSPQVSAALERLERMATAENQPDDQRPYFFSVQAQLLSRQGKIEAAAAKQRRAVEVSPEGRIRQTMQNMLDRLEGAIEER
jgi:thiol-disulfide isomerase/thioredoxin